MHILRKVRARKEGLEVAITPDAITAAEGPLGPLMSSSSPANLQSLPAQQAIAHRANERAGDISIVDISHGHPPPNLLFDDNAAATEHQNYNLAPNGSEAAFVIKVGEFDVQELTNAFTFECRFMLNNWTGGVETLLNAKGADDNAPQYSMQILGYGDKANQSELTGRLVSRIHLDSGEGPDGRGQCEVDENCDVISDPVASGVWHTLLFKKDLRGVDLIVDGARRSKRIIDTVSHPSDNFKVVPTHRIFVGNAGPMDRTFNGLVANVQLFVGEKEEEKLDRPDNASDDGLDS